jgi:hypothetical protein
VERTTFSTWRDENSEAEINLDERSLMHRYKSGSWAGQVGALVLAAWFFWDYFSLGTTRWDFLIVIAAMALTKTAAFFWMRYRD